MTLHFPVLPSHAKREPPTPLFNVEGSAVLPICWNTLPLFMAVGFKKIPHILSLFTAVEKRNNFELGGRGFEYILYSRKKKKCSVISTVNRISFHRKMFHQGGKSTLPPSTRRSGTRSELVNTPRRAQTTAASSDLSISTVE